MDLIKFPFTAEVWGTAADWTMVLVTAATLFLLLKTLRSQLAVQKAQQKTTQIESDRYSKEVMPTFELRKETIDVRVEDGSLIVNFHLLLTLIKNDCLELKVVLERATNGIQLFHSLPIFAERVSSGSGYSVSGRYMGYEMNDTTHDLWSCELTLSLTYIDAIDTRYNQEFSFIHNPSGYVITNAKAVRI